MNDDDVNPNLDNKDQFAEGLEGQAPIPPAIVEKSIGGGGGRLEPKDIPKPPDNLGQSSIRNVLEDQAKIANLRQELRGIEESHAEERPNYAESRREVHESMHQELLDRIKTNPSPTEDELRIGTYAEAIEPMVRRAVFELNRKGYFTTNSGFSPDSPEITSIAGSFTLDKNTVRRLEALGPRISSSHPGHTSIDYQSADIDMNVIKSRWDKIADALPNKGAQARPANNVGAELFRLAFNDRIPEDQLTSQESKALNILRRYPVVELLNDSLPKEEAQRVVLTLTGMLMKTYSRQDINTASSEALKEPHKGGTNIARRLFSRLSGK